MSRPRYPSSTSRTASAPGGDPARADTCPAGMLAPVSLVATGPGRSPAMAAANILVVVVLPLVPLTRATLLPRASVASSLGSRARPTRPPATVPRPRPSALDSRLETLRASTASVARPGRASGAGRAETFTPVVVCGPDPPG